MYLQERLLSEYSIVNKIALRLKIISKRKWSLSSLMKGNLSQIAYKKPETASDNGKNSDIK